VAFTLAEGKLESAYVAWCGVVGAWFTEPENGEGRRPRRLSKSRTREDVSLSPRSSLGHSTTSGWRRSMPSMPTFNGPVPLTPSPSSEVHSPPKPKRNPSVRDLAILPTQRVTRYVLLYRDLLSHTPTFSQSRSAVERAVNVASRIAQKCDRAQGHSAFLHQ